MKKPFISICIPAYKRELSMERLLQSIARQSFSDYEVIISDDSPDDNIKRLAERYKASLPIIYSKNEPAAGTPYNFNIAMLKATGEWIKIMHDDDWFSSEHSLQKFADTARGTDCHFIFSACNNIYLASGKEVHQFLRGSKKKMLEDNTLNLLYDNVIGHPPTTMHRRDDEILYDPAFRWVSDVDFYIRYFLKHPGYVYIPEMMINIGTDDTQVTSSLHKNPKVEVPEYLSLLAKFPSDLLLRHEYVFHCVWDLVRRFHIKDIEMIKQLGYDGPLPDQLQKIIDFQKPLPRFVRKQTDWSKILMKICYRRITQGLNR